MAEHGYFVLHSVVSGATFWFSYNWLTVFPNLAGMNFKILGGKFSSHIFVDLKGVKGSVYVNYCYCVARFLELLFLIMKCLRFDGLNQLYRCGETL